MARCGEGGAREEEVEETDEVKKGEGGMVGEGGRASLDARTGRTREREDGGLPHPEVMNVSRHAQ